jgi:hypothetical protein
MTFTSEGTTSRTRKIHPGILCGPCKNRAAESTEHKYEGSDSFREIISHAVPTCFVQRPRAEI